MQDLTQIDDNAVVFKREGTYQARIRADGKYVYRSLKTGDLAAAIKAAQKLVYEFEFNAKHGIPNSAKTFDAVIDEYVRFRRIECQQGRTSKNMLRQIERVVRFWREFAGKRLITDINDAELSDYVQWRRDYYTQRPNEAKRRNVKINPTDKTIQFDMMIGKAIITWAHSRGLRGKLPLPMFTYTPKKKRVRPAFENGDHRKLRSALLEWIEEPHSPKHHATRLLLRDYAMILSYSGMRVGEANNLRVRDVIRFKDKEDRINYRFIVRGKTGERDVIPVASITDYVVEILNRKGPNPDPDDWFFTMPSGKKITSLADQFAALLKFRGIRPATAGERFTLYSLRHYYAVMALRNGIGIYDIARNMGTSVDMIQQYYGKNATPVSMATALGGKVKAKHKFVDR